MPALRRERQRCLAVDVFHRHVGAVLEQRANNFDVPFRPREHQRRPAFVAVNGVDGGIVFQKQFHRGDIGSGAGVHQGRAFDGVARFDVRARVYEQLGHACVAVESSQHQGGAAVGTARVGVVARLQGTADRVELALQGGGVERLRIQDHRRWLRRGGHRCTGLRHRLCGRGRFNGRLGRLRLVFAASGQQKRHHRSGCYERRKRGRYFSHSAYYASSPPD